MPRLTCLNCLTGQFFAWTNDQKLVIIACVNCGKQVDLFSPTGMKTKVIT